MTIIVRILALVLAVSFSISLHAQQSRIVPIETTALSMADALDAATTAISSCEADGHRVVAIILNPEGNIQVFLRGDGRRGYDRQRRQTCRCAGRGRCPRRRS